MEEKALALRPNVITSLDDVERAAKSMQASGFFKDAASQAQAVVKILAGQEIGFGPFASMNGVHIIQGRPSFSANLMAAAVKRSGRYNYRVIEMTDAVCELAFFEGGQEVGRSKFTKEDANRAGTQNMQKFPRNMLFARAMSNGVKWYCPDVFNGTTVYTPEELGAEVNEDGDVIEGTVIPPTVTPPTNGKSQPAPINLGGKIEMPAERPALTNAEIIDHLTAMSGLPRNRVTSTLKYCELTASAKASLKDYEMWWEEYKNAREDELTPAEAGQYANLMAGNAPDEQKAAEYLTVVTDHKNTLDEMTEGGSLALDGTPFGDK